ncbi:MAG: hypothetical protein ACRCY4_04490 [Brevinema sp.]
MEEKLLSKTEVRVLSQIRAYIMLKTDYLLRQYGFGDSLNKSKICTYPELLDMVAKFKKLGFLEESFDEHGCPVHQITDVGGTFLDNYYKSQKLK